MTILSYHSVVIIYLVSLEVVWNQASTSKVLVVPKCGYSFLIRGVI
jgi:hypothetical protein